MATSSHAIIPVIGIILQLLEQGALSLYFSAAPGITSQELWTENLAFVFKVRVTIA